MRKLLERLYGGYTLAVFSAAALVSGILVIIAPGRQLRRRIGATGMRVALALSGIRLRREGLNHVPGSPCLVVANHVSYLDGLIMTAVLPSHFGFVIKAEAGHVPVLGLFLRRMGASFVTRDDPRRASLETRSLLRTVLGGESLAVFPEGTFSRDEDLGPFRLGAFLIAARATVPVVPAVISGTREILPDQHWLPRHSHIHVRLLPPLSPTGRAREHAAQLRDHARDAITGALASLGSPQGRPGPDRANARRSD